MAITEDLIDFDIIETQKENIQSLPGGRSARALASIFSPSPFDKQPSPTHSDTRNLNDAIRQEYEKEIIAISDYDDPLDIYDRYVKWTLSAYPSAQATPQSQLLPLLERATKAFLPSSHYKNDPRYLKLWLNYIRFFSDSPRETFAFLARHNIGEGLALFYEEFAAWLEGAGRWTQAEEVYKLGLEREARPAERLLRKFGEFLHRFEKRPQNGDEPSSPALPTVRPALAAKIDPFAAATPQSTDPQASRPSSAVAGSSTGRPARQKLAIFSDTDGTASAGNAGVGETAKGWENIGSLQDRKKENTMEARPWAGETLKAGKKVAGTPKMMVFKDESVSGSPPDKNVHNSRLTNPRPITINPKTGKAESVLANMEAIYPDWPQMSSEMSFEELRAAHRGWMCTDWAAEKQRRVLEETPAPEVMILTNNEEPPNPVDVVLANAVEERLVLEEREVQLESTIIKEGSREGRSGRPRKTKIMEVKGEPQTIKTNLESPTGPKLKRKLSAEPTMTVHTRAATDEIYGIFSQPLKTAAPLEKDVDSNYESDFDDDDYTSAGESTGTGKISGTSEFGDDETGIKIFEETDTGVKSVSEWSEFTASKHIPRIDQDEGNNSHNDLDNGFVVLEDNPTEQGGGNSPDELVTPISPMSEQGPTRTRFIPLPPEDYEPPTYPYRDVSQASQNRPPFMTPIVEKTESSLAPSTVYQKKDYFNSKTPPRKNDQEPPAVPEIDDRLLSSPFQEIINEAKTGHTKLAPSVTNLQKSKDKPHIRPRDATVKKDAQPKGPIITDVQCNPVDDSIRKTILEHIQPPLSSYDGFFEHKAQYNGKSAEIRKFAKAVTKTTKNSTDKTTTNLSMPPVLRFEGTDRVYTIKRELGKGAFAPVYLAEKASAEEEDNTEDDNGPAVMGKGKFGINRQPLEAIKMEDPPTAWEFYIMRQAKRRLGVSRAADSIIHTYELHLFADECFLIEEYRDQGTLLDLVNLAKAETSTSTSAFSSGGVMDETLAMFFTVELFRTVEALHSKGLLHGDLKADNCLLRLDPLSSGNDVDWSPRYCPDGTGGWASKGLALIDFGRGIDLKAFRNDVQFVADWKTGPADCAEMREMRPWTYQVDYFGLAGVVHSLLFGKYIDTVVVAGKANNNPNTTTSTIGCGVGVGAGKKTYKIKESLKRYWQVDIWNHVFDLLLNPSAYVQGEEGGRLPVTRALRECREEMEGWLVVNGEKRALRALLGRVEGRCGVGRR
ncbi:MAG: hypothetical protein M1830_008540 [Pleopsidium flavum]|nr:MAG: hypothetical protein M1830_008540 [Pleopsidium flavum]